MSPEWSLITREVLYVRANARRFRDRVTLDLRQREHLFKAGTIEHWYVVLRDLESMAAELEIGLPSRWSEHDVRRLRVIVVERFGVARYGMMVRTLHRMAPVLSLGGLRFDPTRDAGIAVWSGDTTSNRTLATQGIDPETFREVVGNALAYVEQCAPDILKAIAWVKDFRPDRATGGAPVPRDHPVRLQHPDVTHLRHLRTQNAIDAIGGIPTATVPRMSSNTANVGDVCIATLRYAAGNVRISNGSDEGMVERRIASGTPKVPGGLPIPISEITRADGSVGPWRPAFCFQSVSIEAQTLQDACKIVLMAFTAMRDSELSSIPRLGWRTVWHGADAITTPLIKNAAGEPMKWWATPAVIRACEVLEQLAEPTWDHLLRTLPVLRDTDGRPPRDVARTGFASTTRADQAKNWQAVQDFVRRINTDDRLMGFLPITAGWGGGRRRDDDGRKQYLRSSDDLPMLNPRTFRFTLASISNFVGLGDVAFQQQAKHAAVSMSHSYAANGATTAWQRTVLNTLTNRDAQERVAKAADLYMREWEGEQRLAGHAGRGLTRTIRDLLAGLPIEPYDPEAEESEVDQFTTQVMRVPELAAAIKSTAAILYPGTVNHCLRYAPQMECTDKAEPMQGLCRPETCRNVLLEEDQQELVQYRLDQVVGWLGMPRVPSAQRAVFEQRKRRLEAQLRVVEEDD
ncbi:hypothetical protein [Modestobacter sp. SSW1-42]|uniref:hypothetical protein n=1 Tax=Modestobacter sp. SSW1-42 TaxID=596372 RepID=UPI003987BF4D